VNRLESLDEVEELDLVLDHYAVTWAMKLVNGPKTGYQADWLTWSLESRSGLSL